MQTTAAQSGNICPLCDYWMFAFVFACTFRAHQFRRKYIQAQVGAHMPLGIWAIYIYMAMCVIYIPIYENLMHSTKTTPRPQHSTQPRSNTRFIIYCFICLVTN